MKRWVIYLLLVFLVGCSDSHKTAPEKTQDVVVRAQTEGERLYYSGRIEPRATTVIASPVDGFVESMPAVFGDQVNQGQTVMILTSPDIETTFADALVSFLKAKDHLATSDHKLKGEKELLDEGIIARNDYQRDQSEEETAYVEYLRSLNNLRQMAALVGEQADDLEKLSLHDMRTIQTALSKKSQVLIKAPQAGKLLSPLVAEHEKLDHHINDGAKVTKGQALGLISNSQGVAVRILVNEVDINHLKTGLAAEVTGDAFPGQTLQGRVTRVVRADIANSSSDKGVQFPVLVEVPKLTSDQAKLIQAGMTAKVALMLPGQGGVLVPLAAVKQHQGRSVVRRVSALGHVDWVPVKTGQTTQSDVVVLDGLEVGDKVRIRD